MILRKKDIKICRGPFIYACGNDRQKNFAKFNESCKDPLIISDIPPATRPAYYVREVGGDRKYYDLLFAPKDINIYFDEFGLRNFWKNCCAKPEMKDRLTGICDYVNKNMQNCCDILSKFEGDNIAKKVQAFFNWNKLCVGFDFSIISNSKNELKNMLGSDYFSILPAQLRKLGDLYFLRDSCNY
jgi:hypothetical protein